MWTAPNPITTGEPNTVGKSVCSLQNLRITLVGSCVATEIFEGMQLELL
jgi:hypothetical protein